MADIQETKQAVIDNPVTVVAAVGAIVAAVGAAVGLTPEIQLVIVQAILGAALLVKLAVAAGKRSSV